MYDRALSHDPEKKLVRRVDNNAPNQGQLKLKSWSHDPDKTLPSLSHTLLTPLSLTLLTSLSPTLLTSLYHTLLTSISGLSSSFLSSPSPTLPILGSLLRKWAGIHRLGAPGMTSEMTHPILPSPATCIAIYTFLQRC